MTLRITILGCGSSGGVPRVGGPEGAQWGACDPAEPKNHRRRCSILVERIGTTGTTRVLVDAGPDLRSQLLDAAVPDLNAVLITHEHADHIHGIDDLRPLVISRKERLDVWTDPGTAAALRERFSYVFVQPKGSSYPPILTLKEMGNSLTIDGTGGPITAVAHIVEHGPGVQARGFRFDNIAYTPDISDLDSAAWQALDGVDLWIVDALRRDPHPTHSHLDQTLEWIKRLGPERAVVTNLHNDLDYAALRDELPESIIPAYDGLVLEV